MKRNSRTWKLIIAVFILVVALVVVRAHRIRQLESAPKLQSAAVPVTVAVARMGRVTASVDELGVLTSQTESAIAPQVMARLIAVDKREGDRVRAGEVIARLDPQELQDAQAAQAAQMDSALESAAGQVAEVARAREDLAARNADVGAAQSSVQAQLADVDAARQTVTAQQAQVDAVKANLAAAQSAAATQKARTARDKILYQNKAISLEQWEASQTAAVQADAGVAALNHQIDALSRGVDAANRRVTSMLRGVDAAKQRAASLKAMAADARQHIVAQQRTAAAARHQASAMASTASMGRTRLGYTLIRAPYDGLITARLAEPGDLLAPGQAVYRILKPGLVKVVVSVPQESLPLLRIGTPAMLALHGNQVRASVTRVYPALGAGRLGTVEIDIPRAPFGLKSGSTLGVSLQTTSRTGVVVPSASVLDSNRGSFVYAVVDGVLRLRQVTVAARNNDQTVLSTGLQAGTQVAVAQPSELMAFHDGQKAAPIASGAEGSDEIR